VLQRRCSDATARAAARRRLDWPLTPINGGHNLVGRVGGRPALSAHQTRCPTFHYGTRPEVTGIFSLELLLQLKPFIGILCKCRLLLGINIPLICQEIEREADSEFR